MKNTNEYVNTKRVIRMWPDSSNLDCRMIIQKLARFAKGSELEHLGLICDLQWYKVCSELSKVTS